MKKIGIIGSGPVGKALGNGFLKYGHSVMIGSRDAGKLAEWKERGGSTAYTGSVEEAAKFGEILVLAVKGEIAKQAIESAGIANLEGKTIIDTTNPLDSTKPPVNGVISLFTGNSDSLMERLQQAAPSANFVKCFNSVGNAAMVDPKFSQGKPSMFICGNSEDAKNEVKEILDKFGWVPEDLGKVEGARAIEPLVVLWCIPGFLRNEWTHALAVLRN